MDDSKLSGTQCHHTNHQAITTHSSDFYVFVDPSVLVFLKATDHTAESTQADIDSHRILIAAFR